MSSPNSAAFRAKANMFAAAGFYEESW
jgi:hypothetical protein